MFFCCFVLEEIEFEYLSGTMFNCQGNFQCLLFFFFLKMTERIIFYISYMFLYEYSVGIDTRWLFMSVQYRIGQIQMYLNVQMFLFKLDFLTNESVFQWTNIILSLFDSLFHHPFWHTLYRNKHKSRGRKYETRFLFQISYIV